MESPEQNLILQFPGNQPQNGRYGRIPMDLAPKLRELSHLEVHVFTILSIFANFSRKPLGLVEMSMSEIAREVGIKRWSLYRTLSALERTGLVETVSSGDTRCLMVRHYLSPHVTPPVSPCDTKSPQPQPSIDSCTPLRRSEEVSEEETTTVAAELPVKKKQKRSPSWLIWSVEKDKLVTRNGDSNGNQEFMSRWKERLGEEDIIWAEKEAAEKWLRENPEKRIRVKRFDMFFGKWLEKRWEAS